MHKLLFYNKFIICLYMFRALLCFVLFLYMFRALLCSKHVEEYNKIIIKQEFVH